MGFQLSIRFDVVYKQCPISWTLVGPFLRGEQIQKQVFAVPWLDPSQGYC